MMNEPKRETHESGDSNPSDSASGQDAEYASLDATGSLMRALHESREALLLVLEGSPDAVFVEDAGGNVLYANSTACRLHEMTREELVGTNVLDLVPPDQRESVALSFDGWRTGALNEYKGFSYTKTGKSIPVEIRASSVVFQGQRALILNVRDISERLHAETEREALQEKLQKSQKLESLGVMAGGVAHDFNNLLMGILGNAELAVGELDDDSSLAESLRGIEVSAAQASELCRQMLAYAGQGKSRIERMNVNEVIQDILDLLAPAGLKNAELRFELDPGLPEVEGDVGQIQQIILNLVMNACEALDGEAGFVDLKTSTMDCDEAYLKNTWLADSLPSGTYVSLEISDVGIGMDEDTLRKIFDPFFTTKITGRGLGLAAVLGIIRGHRGAIQVVSSPGDGSTFTVLLPTAMKAAAGRPSIPMKAMSEGPVTVMVVDDESSIRSVTGRMLRRMNICVIETCGGEEAVSVLQERGDEISCALVDLSMPRVDGVEAILQMREVRGDLPVILMSGYDKHEATERLADVDLQGFLQKPFHSDSLRAALRETVEFP
jgi:PAS domain S-box-containing protein